MRRPILVVDCFAGPGKFDDGQSGSPLLISDRLQQAQGNGARVLGFYIEKDPILYTRLAKNMQGLRASAYIRSGDFREHMDEISDLARTHTVFVYLDPIKPSDLLFTDMECVYRQLEHGRSVEVLINFMSTGFFRAVAGLASQIAVNGVVDSSSELVCHWNSVAGGIYWQDIIFGQRTPDPDCVEQLARGYARRLKEQFDWVISYPIRDKYEHKLPKYHLMFGSRHPDAVELMNRAMVKARREFVGARFVKGHLFENQPEAEVIRPEEIEATVHETCRQIGKTTWRDLRARTTVANPCVYTDSEINRAIKRAIQTRKLGSNCCGKRIEEHALVWPIG